MQHEKATRHPFVDIAGQDRDFGCVRARDGATLVDPFADKDLQALVLWPRFAHELRNEFIEEVMLIE